MTVEVLLYLHKNGQVPPSVFTGDGATPLLHKWWYTHVAEPRIAQRRWPTLDRLLELLVSDVKSRLAYEDKPTDDLTFKITWVPPS